MNSQEDWFMLSNQKEPWTKSEVEKVLGDNLLEREQGKHVIKCVLSPDHEKANIRIETGGNYVKSFSYHCRICMFEEHISEEKQSQLFGEWLKPRELIDRRWKPHTNPFDIDPVKTELAFRPDSEGQPLLYRGAVHFIYGKPATFKSWFALSTFLDGDVRLWDFENGISPTKSRLEALGVTREMAGGYTIPASESEIMARVSEYVRMKPDILCIDGFSGLTGVLGVNPDSNWDVLRVFNQIIYPLKDAGITVLILDHLPKDGSSDDYPIGAQTKKAQADVSLLFKKAKSEGFVDIFVTKDRHGLLLERSEEGTAARRLGTLTLIPDDQYVSVQINPAYFASIGSESVRTNDAKLMESVYTFIAQNPGCNKNQIEKGVIGKTELKRKALKRLIDNGVITQNTVGTSYIHFVDGELNLEWLPVGQD